MCTWKHLHVFLDALITHCRHARYSVNLHTDAGAVWHRARTGEEACDSKSTLMSSTIYIFVISDIRSFICTMEWFVLLIYPTSHSHRYESLSIQIAYMHINVINVVVYQPNSEIEYSHTSPSIVNVSQRFYTNANNLHSLIAHHRPTVCMCKPDAWLIDLDVLWEHGLNQTQ